MRILKKLRKFIIAIVVLVLIYLTPMFLLFLEEKSMIDEMKSDLINYELNYLTKMYELRSEIYGETNSNLDEILQREKEKFYKYCKESNYRCRFGVGYNFNYIFEMSSIWIRYEFDDETKKIYKNLGKVEESDGKYYLVLSNYSQIESDINYITNYLYHDSWKIINWDREEYGKKVNESEISRALEIDLELPNNASSVDMAREFYLIKGVKQ